MTEQELKDILDKHKLWLGREEGGVRANLEGANLRDANLRNANLRDAYLRNANLWDADLRDANLRDANLWDANLEGANLRDANLWDAYLDGANLRDAYLRGANLRDANLEGAYLEGAYLLCFGNMREIRTMQIDTWAIGYTADTLQIGCQRHPIDKWRKWDTPAGRKWIASMDDKALKWADRNLALVLAMIDANPATPTGHEVKKDD
jgi:hypothetical protein